MRIHAHRMHHLANADLQGLFMQLEADAVLEAACNQERFPNAGDLG